jgi:hypothetical protein
MESAGIWAIILVIFYFAPLLVARSRKHKSYHAIALVNVFLGWTVIGWLWAAIWAHTGNTSEGEPTPDTHVKCPDCAELVKREAKVCKHCGCKLVPQ